MLLNFPVILLKEEIKKLGTKVSANIIDVCSFVGRFAKDWHRKYHANKAICCLTVAYDNNNHQKTSRIEFIEDNDAYKLLEMLLNSYPINKKVYIPIDIYIYKNKIYADLYSVDLTKVEGYEECKKLIDEAYHKN